MYLLFFNNGMYKLLTNYNLLIYILLIKYLLVVCKLINYIHASKEYTKNDNISRHTKI